MRKTRDSVTAIVGQDHAAVRSLRVRLDKIDVLCSLQGGAKQSFDTCVGRNMERPL